MELPQAGLQRPVQAQRNLLLVRVVRDRRRAPLLPVPGEVRLPDLELGRIEHDLGSWSPYPNVDGRFAVEGRVR